MNFLCPHCKQDLKCDDELSGQVLRCPNCNGKLRAPSVAKKKESDSSAAVETPPTESQSGPDTGIRKKQQSTKQEPAGTSGAWRPTDSSNVSILLSFGCGMVFAIAFYLLTLPVRHSYFGLLFWERGWVPFVLVVFLGWSLAILVLKYRKLQQQRRAMLLDILPESIAEDITPLNVDRFLSHIGELPAKLHDTLIVKRMTVGLQHFRVRQSNPEVASMMMSQSEIDASTIASSYSLLKVFLWAIPILGFIGTVMGISAAVGGFSGSLEAANDISVLKESLNGVTGGLAVAFDTTLVALCMSLVISFPLNATQKAEEDLLSTVDAYCNENLLKRLADIGALTQEQGDASSVLQAVSQRIASTQQTILVEFQGMLSQQTEYLQRMAEIAESHTTSLEGRAAAFQEGLVAALDQTLSPISAQTEAVLANHRAAMEQLSAAVEQQFSSMEKRADSFQTKLATRLEPLDGMKSHIVAMSEALGSLNSVLKDLGEKQVVIQQTPRRWFSSASRK